MTEPLRVTTVDGALDDAARAAVVFAGGLLVHRGLPAMAALVARAAALVRRQFDADEPALAQQVMARDRFLAAAAAAQADFGADAEVGALAAEALAEAGVDASAAWWDKRALRVLPSGDTHSGGRLSTTHVHRDTWGSNLYAQVNWWAPVFALEPGRTIAFYPDRWLRPVANTSDRWSFEEYLARRVIRDGVVRNGYPPAPEPLEAIDPEAGCRVMVNPGDLLCFSAAHLHVGVPNRTGRVRFSIETRTIAAADLDAGRAAPNVDGHGRVPRVRWFRHLRDGGALPASRVPGVPPPAG